MIIWNFDKVLAQKSGKMMIEEIYAYINNTCAPKDLYVKCIDDIKIDLEK